MALDFSAVLALRRLSQVDPSVGVLVKCTTHLYQCLLRWGSDDLRQNIPAEARGRDRRRLRAAEAGSGSDELALATRARASGKEFVLTGRKLWITNAHEADVFVVFATVDPTAGYKGITAFIIERGFRGFTVGKKEDKLGIRASSTCELLLEDCPVPKENVLGEIGRGYKVAIETLNEGRIGIGAQMVGLAQGALDHAIAYIKDRKQFGRAIADFQGVQFQVARAATELEAARLMVYHAARLRDGGKPFLTQAAMCKLFASEMAEHVTSLAVQLFGGYATQGLSVDKLYATQIVHIY